MNAVPAKKLSQTQSAYVVLKQQILDNEIPANTQMLETEVAERLNMSRTPVREALQKLANDGLVEVIPRHGIRILPLSARDMAEIYTILTGLESTAAEQIAQRGLNQEEVAILQKSVDDMDAALLADDLKTWAAADEAFHKQLVALTYNSRLISLVDLLMDQSHRARMITLKLRPKPSSSNDDHRSVVEAIARGDANTAGQLHREHRTKSGLMLVNLLEELGLNQL